MHGSSDTVRNGLMKESTFDLKRKVSNPDLSVPIQNIPSQPPPVPNRPASYTPSTHDSLNVLNNLDTVRNYGSAADELETTGIHYHIPDFPEYLAALNSATGGTRSRPSNSLSNAPSLPRLPSNSSSDSQSGHKAPWEFDFPNILGSYEDDKHRDNMAKHMPGFHSPVINTRPLVGRGSRSAANMASISSLPASENDDDLNGCHWDTLDWAPHPSLSNINEVTANEMIVSRPSSPPSYNNNERVPMLTAAAMTAMNSMTQVTNTIPDHDFMTDSEYVGETENELDFEDREDMPPDYADLPCYDQLLAQRDLNISYELPNNMSVHPNPYLPYYQDQDSTGEIQTEEEISNPSDEQNNVVDMAVAQHVAERASRQQPPGRVFLSPGYATSGEYTTDLEPLSHTSFIDDMSMSVGGYTSNASCSDISGLCEIEDSELNGSENEREDDENTPCLPSHIHTQV
ncbi:protocadherin Fat 1-like [Babylonia areolata]|uniref:protocadherin Fat 1-like n=1 Tax=Babylonia areolata TaxID=304850 RepID=UPI003FD16E04